MSRRREPIDRYPGPDRIWFWWERSRRTIAVLAFGLLVFVVAGVFVKYWRGGCAGTDADRAAVAALRVDPLLTALPPGATSIQDETVYRSCGRSEPQGRYPRSESSIPMAFEYLHAYKLAGPITARELYDFHTSRVGQGDWRLTQADAQSLYYCRAMGGMRLVAVMTVHKDRLTTQIFGWIDGGECDPQIALI